MNFYFSNYFSLGKQKSLEKNEVSKLAIKVKVWKVF
jgi:hypothetical protein